MQIAVFDTYVRRPDGRTMHFDILVPTTTRERDIVLAHGRAYLATKGVDAQAFATEECRFCHVASASPAIEADIRQRGFSILELQDCD